MVAGPPSPPPPRQGLPVSGGEDPQLKSGNQVAPALLTHPVTRMGLLLDVSTYSRMLLTSNRLVPTADGGRWGKKSGEASSSPELPDASAASRDPEAAPKTDTPYSPTLCCTEAKASANALWVGCRTGPLLCCSNLFGGPTSTSVWALPSLH